MRNLSICLLVILFFSCNSEEKNKELILETFLEYKKAVVDRRGVDALPYIDNSTVDYYQLTVERACNINSNELRKLSLIDKLLIITIRHKFRASEIKKLTGESLLVWAIDNGFISSAFVKDAGIQGIKINSDSAIANFTYMGHKLPNTCHFIKEDKIWKMKLTALFEYSDKSLKQIANSKNITHREFIFDMLRKTSDTEVNPEIWERMIE
ncbi:MAG: hypothetical protein RBS81_00130 [Tenuifilaceae bacterium]|jgi:hypothetical protein|nr:hypothetical protein [Tenuifilaceae bacterium]